MDVNGLGTLLHLLGFLTGATLSALHLSGAEHGVDPWWIQPVGHHGSLALVFAILYQDYRFALADLFLRRGA